MYSRTKLKKMKRELDKLDLKSGLNEEQIAWIKNKLAQAETVITNIKAKQQDIEARLDALENP